MVAKHKKAKVSQEEMQLKSLGRDKFALAQSLDAGREVLGRIAERDSSDRDAERLRSNVSANLGIQPIEETAKVGYQDSRVPAGISVAAKANSDEEQLGANLSLINADMGIESAATSSLRTAAQSKAQLAEQAANNAMKLQSDQLNVVGSVAGAALGAVDFASTDPLANPNQIKPDLDSAIITNPNANRRVDFNSINGINPNYVAMS